MGCFKEQRTQTGERKIKAHRDKEAEEEKEMLRKLS
jgi:hypothetical protein